MVPWELRLTRRFSHSAIIKEEKEEKKRRRKEREEGEEKKEKRGRRGEKRGLKGWKRGVRKGEGTQTAQGLARYTYTNLIP